MKRFLPLLLAAVCFASALAQTIIPDPIKPGSKIAIVTPAWALETPVIDRALRKLRAKGYRPVVMPHAYGRLYGNFPANDSLRAADLMAAFANPDIEAIICTRGGQGANRLLEYIDTTVIKQNPKWLVGYSDITNLHAVLNNLGIASIHGPMCGHIATEPYSDTSSQMLYSMLESPLPHTIHVDGNAYNNPGRATGRVVGGNFLVLCGLAETPWDVINPSEDSGTILFIEDVSEKIPAIERMLTRLHLSGALSRLQGLIIGEFTDYDATDDFASMEQMIDYWLRHWGYYDKGLPVLYGFPVGHDLPNYPIILGAEATLEVDRAGGNITWR